MEEDELELGGKKLNRLPQYDLDSDVSESESDGSHLDIDLSETEDVPVEEAADAEDEDEEPDSAPTKRIAAVNLDWDNLRAVDLYSVFNSFLNMKRKGESSSTGLGRLVDVKIFPSQFGKERMEKEEQEGPGGGIFVGNAGRSKKKSGIILDSDEEHDEEDLEGDAGSGSDDEELDYEVDDDEVDDIHDLEGSDLGDEESDEDESAEEGLDGQQGGLDGLEIVSDVSSEPDEGDIDMDKLREYQLERLR